MFDPDGDHAAADSTRSSTSRGTGRSVNPRTARRLVTASYTSMIAYLRIRYVFYCIIQYDFNRYYSRGADRHRKQPARTGANSCRTHPPRRATLDSDDLSHRRGTLTPTAHTH